MKVDGYGNILNTSGVKKRGGVSVSGNFSGFLNAAEGTEATETEAASNNSGVSDISAPASLSGILALQEVSEDEIRKKKLIQQGHSMLDSLESLRRQLLLGTLPASTLRDIEKNLLVQRQTIIDPRLMMILDDIELRTAVELAKLEMAIASKSVLE